MCQPRRQPSAARTMVVIVLLAGMGAGALLELGGAASSSNLGSIFSGFESAFGSKVAGAPSAKAGSAVRYALAQKGKPYRWGAEGPGSYDCSGLTWRAWRHAGVSIPRTAAGQLGLRKVRGKPKPGDLLVYRSNGPSGRHVAMYVGKGRMVEARGRGIPVRVATVRRGPLGIVRPGAR